MSDNHALVREAVAFLRDRNPRVRQAACAQIAGLTMSTEGVQLLKAAAGSDLVNNLARLIGDADQTTASNAVKALINIVVDDNDLYKKALQTNVVSRVLDTLLESSRLSPEDIKIYIQLLSNITIHEDGVKKLLCLDDSSLKGFYLVKLTSLLVREKVTSPNGTDKYAWIASVIANCTQLKEGRDMILDKSKGILKLLLPHIDSPSLIRRRGVIATIKNCMFESSYHPELVKDDVDIISKLLYPLRGPEKLDAEDLQDMDPRLHAPKTRETDLECRQMLMEALLLLTAERVGRDALKRKKAYPIMREYEKVEKNETILEAIYNLVNVLLRDEEEDGSSSEAPASKPAPSTSSSAPATATSTSTSASTTATKASTESTSVQATTNVTKPKEPEKPQRKIELDERGEEIEEI